MISILTDDLCILRDLTENQSAILIRCLETHYRYPTDLDVTLEQIQGALTCRDPECTDCIEPPEELIIEELGTLSVKGLCQYNSEEKKNHVTAKGARIAHLVNYVVFMKEAGLQTAMERVTEAVGSGDMPFSPFDKSKMH